MPEWFKDWFNSPYYHLLYHNRNADEARFFLDNLTIALKLPLRAQLLDLACGRGRHAIYLNQKGYDVTGLDIAPKSIAYAQQFANEHLRFAVHDMRQPYQTAIFDGVFNLFTSFGYFESDGENRQAIRNVAEALKPGGRFVLDYLNTPKVARNLVPAEIKTVAGVKFKITRWLEDSYFVKTIDFAAEGQNWHFEERVQAITQAKFEEYFAAAGLTISRIWGSYRLDPYQENSSDRMVWVLQK